MNELNIICDNSKMYQLVDILANNVNQLIQILDKEFRIDFINENIHYKLLGFNKEELIGKNFFEMVDPSVISQDKEKILEFLQEGEFKSTLKLLNKNKEPIWIDIKSIPFYNEKGEKQILLIANKSIHQENDSSKDFKVISANEKLKLHDEPLKSALEKLKLIYDFVNDFIVVLNEKGKFIEINQKVVELLGYSKEELLEMSPIDISISEEAQLVEERIKDTFKDGANLFEIKLYDYKKRIIPLELNAKLLQFNDEPAIIAVGRNILERKRMESSIKESELKYRSILENIREGYYEIDINGDFTFLNNYFSELLNYSPEQLFHKNLIDLIDTPFKNLFLQALNFVRLKKAHLKNVQLELIKGNGYKIYLEISIDLRLSEEGNELGFFGLVRDISDQKKTQILESKFKEELEKEVELRTKELNQALELQELYLDELAKSSHFKTEFLATMSHELRTPLNAIIGFTDLLLEQCYGELNMDQLEFLNDIKSSAEHQLDMIKNILDITKIESGKMVLNLSTFSLNTLVNQILSNLKPLYSKKNLYLEVIGLHDEREIKADPIKFKEILFNLLSNAIKFTIKGGITLIFQQNSNEWVFKVKDTGIGIAESDHDIIFKEFKRVNNPYVNSIQGTGLGLSLTKRLVVLHGGTITFESELGKGSTFTFTIPKSGKRKKVNVEDFLTFF